MNNERRLPSLDGCRAIAILLVIYWHLSFSTRGSFPTVAFDWGTLGVYIFFVISGFLITTLLQRERQRWQSISLKEFYVRRFFRIIPPLTFFLIGVWILTRFGLAFASGRAILFSFSFLRNYHPGPYRILHHLWSLSVEEQFYLVWPFLFTYLSKRTVCRLLMCVIVAAPIIRLVASFWVGDLLSWNTEQVADGLAWGCLLAIKQPELRSNRLYQWLSHSYAAFLLPCIITAAAYTYHQKLYAGIGKLVIFSCVAMSLDIVMLRFDSVVGRILNSAPLVVIGKISYSLYLWQQVFLIVKRSDQPYAWFPLNIGLGIACGLISYFAIEQPAIKLGRRIIARRSRRAVEPPVSLVADLSVS